MAVSSGSRRSNWLGRPISAGMPSTLVATSAHNTFRRAVMRWRGGGFFFGFASVIGGNKRYRTGCSPQGRRLPQLLQVTEQ